MKQRTHLRNVPKEARSGGLLVAVPWPVKKERLRAVAAGKANRIEAAQLHGRLDNSLQFRKYGPCLSARLKQSLIKPTGGKQNSKFSFSEETDRII